MASGTSTWRSINRQTAVNPLPEILKYWYLVLEKYCILGCNRLAHDWPPFIPTCKALWFSPSLPFEPYVRLRPNGIVFALGKFDFADTLSPKPTPNPCVTVLLRSLSVNPARIPLQPTGPNTAGPSRGGIDASPKTEECSPPRSVFLNC